MIKDYSNILASKRQTVKGRSLKIGSDGFLGKTFGVAITVIMLCVFCGSVFMGMMLKAGLSELAYKESEKKEIVQVQQRLIAEKEQLLAQGNFEVAASDLGLYAVSAKQVRHF